MGQPIYPPQSGRFPQVRPRRLRQSRWIRRLVAETRLAPDDLIQPMFVAEAADHGHEIASMPSVRRLSVDGIVRLAEQAAEVGVPAIALFPATPPERKSADAREAWNEDNLVCRAIRALRRAVPELGVIADVALDPYTDHGHDGLLIDGRVANDPTLEALQRQAVCLAAAGCDVVAPSDMMDGRIGAIREALDQAGRQDVLILAYAAKYASSFYGPFRAAVGSAGSLGGADKKTYQMDPANGAEALREVALDLVEAADMVMIKPGMPYLDVIARVKDAFGIPTLAYQVSGEYAMIKAADRQGWLDGDATMREALLCFRRAGADAILTYAAIDVARSLRTG